MKKSEHIIKMIYFSGITALALLAAFILVFAWANGGKLLIDMNYFGEMNLEITIVGLIFFAGIVNVWIYVHGLK